MPEHPTPRPTGFHPGEIVVQRAAGVLAEAARLEGMLAPAQLSAGIARFLAAQNYAAFTARDDDGVLWVSPLTGDAGFITAIDPDHLRIARTPASGDPLFKLPVPQPVGMIVIDYAHRRRVRINGRLVDASDDGITIAVEQAYGNCPQYIPRRVPNVALDSSGAMTPPPSRRSKLTQADQALIAHATSVVFGTTHSTRGNDASHRGGRAGFITTVSGRNPGGHDVLVWPDFPGNNMFNSLGNLAIDPHAALLISDPASGRTLYLSGTATTAYLDRDVPSGLDTGRAVEFSVESAISGPPINLRFDG